VNAIDEGNLVAVSVLSGNRNFEGRVHAKTRANYLASPPLVVAYALAGRTDIDLINDPIGEGTHGPVYLRDIWPTNAEVKETVHQSLQPEMFLKQYGHTYTANETWNAIARSGGELYNWDETSTYVQEPPFFTELTLDVQPIQNVARGRVLIKCADSVTTDHISPAGSIAKNSPAAEYLLEHGVEYRVTSTPTVHGAATTG
jgi:aconitate hydratase